MPSTNSTPTQGAPRKRSLLPLYLIVLITLAPIVFAVLAYYVPALGLRPEGHTNYGTLVTPQRPMPTGAALQVKTLEGEPFDLASLHGQWLLVSADVAACPESCVRKLFVLRNSHASQGKNVERLSRVWFVLDDGKVPEQVLEAYKGTHILRADPAQLAAFLAPDATPAERDAALKQPMWFIDPLGNLMMQYPADAEPTSVRDDLSKLIRNSRIG